jgi:hypothetical protein
VLHDASPRPPYAASLAALHPSPLREQKRACILVNLHARCFFNGVPRIPQLISEVHLIFASKFSGLDMLHE